MTTPRDLKCFSGQEEYPNFISETKFSIGFPSNSAIIER